MALHELDTIVSPNALLRWHRRLVAQKWNFAERRSAGRRASCVIFQSWLSAWRRTIGAGATPAFKERWPISITKSAVERANVLKRNGIEPAPERSRRTTWSTFLK